MTPITKPGMFQDISAVQYHADCCPEPSLSSSIAKLLISKSPKHAWLAHSRLGGAKQEDEEESPDPSASKAKALGELIHRLVLGKGGDVVVIDADSYRSAAAKAQRDLARAQGNIPVLAHKFPEAESAAAECRAQLDAMGYDYVFRQGMTEVVICWIENGIWHRAMIDNLHIDEDTKTAEWWDLKTVSRSSHPEACAKQIADLGYDFSAIFQTRGLMALRPDLAGRIKRRWAFLEVNPPYATTPVEISAEWDMAAEVRCERAIALWRKCVTENKFPYYVDQLTCLEPKPWMVIDAFANNE